MAVKLQVDLASAVPITKQIVDGFRVLLLEGAFEPGAELPSVRRLAMECGVHFNTVADAYRLLAAEGWLELKHGRTARVKDRPKPVPDKSRFVFWRSRLRELTAQMAAEGISRIAIRNELKKAAKECV